MRGKAGHPQRSTGRPVVVGVADHNGWAILVSAAAVNGEPTVVDRRRVGLIETGVPTQPYHHETLALRDAEAEELLRQVERSIAKCTALAFDRLSADLRPRYRVSAVTLRHSPLGHLPATVGEVHGSYYVLCRADGMLYHSAICTAARQRGWELGFHRRGEEVARAAKALQASAHEVERFMNDLRRTLKPPWAAEHRNAFASAIGRLGERSRLRVPRTGTIVRGEAG
jgi:hypothetical protein